MIYFVIYKLLNRYGYVHNNTTNNKCSNNNQYLFHKNKYEIMTYVYKGHKYIKAKCVVTQKKP